MKTETYIKEVMKKVNLPAPDKAAAEADLRAQIEEMRQAGKWEWRIRRKLGQPRLLGKHLSGTYGHPAERKRRSLKRDVIHLSILSLLTLLISLSSYITARRYDGRAIETIAGQQILGEVVYRVQPVSQVMRGLALGFLFAGIVFVIIELISIYNLLKLGPSVWNDKAEGTNLQPATETAAVTTVGETKPAKEKRQWKFPAHVRNVTDKAVNWVKSIPARFKKDDSSNNM